MEWWEVEILGFVGIIFIDRVFNKKLFVVWLSSTSSSKECEIILIDKFFKVILWEKWSKIFKNKIRIFYTT